MAYYLMSPDEGPTDIAPSLKHKKKGVGTLSYLDASHIAANEEEDQEPATTNGDGCSDSAALSANGKHEEQHNPTVLPRDVLDKFHFVFLIRHPSKSIPSFWKLCVPPCAEQTGFDGFMADEAGYAELRRLFDYLVSIGQIGPDVANRGDSSGMASEICVVDADDLLDYPADMVERFCRSAGIDYEPEMLNWGGQDHQDQAVRAFEKWQGWHDDALNSSELKPRQHKHVIKSLDDDYKDWTDKFGGEAADAIRATVEANVDDYNYLKQYAIKINGV